jgi:TIR domain
MGLARGISFRSNGTMAHDGFISYAGEDKSTANAACTALESEGISCWIAPRDIRTGAKWEQAIMDAISASRVTVPVFSEDANRSYDVQREVGSAF